MPRTNEQVEQILSEYSELLAIAGGDPYKPRAYEKAARSIGGYHAELSDLDPKGILAIPNVGKSIGEKVQEYLQTGSIQAVEELRAQIPAGVRQLMQIPTLGPKKAMALYEELHIGSVEELMDAVHEHRLEGVKGFGAKTEENILRGVRQLQEAGQRVQIGVALDLAEEMLGELGALKSVRQCCYAGSLRRMA